MATDRKRDWLTPCELATGDRPSITHCRPFYFTLRGDKSQEALTQDPSTQEAPDDDDLSGTNVSGEDAPDPRPNMRRELDADVGGKLAGDGSPAAQRTRRHHSQTWPRHCSHPADRNGSRHDRITRNVSELNFVDPKTPPSQVLLPVGNCGQKV